MESNWQMLDEEQEEVVADMSGVVDRPLDDDSHEGRPG